MRSILIAFLLGIALAATVFFLVGSPSEGPLLAEQGEQPAEEASAAGTSMPMVDPVSGVEVTPASTSTENATAEAATNPVSDQVVPLSVSPISRPPTPILVMPDGTEIQSGVATSEVHSAIENEPVNSAWAAITESELYSFYAQSAALTNNFYASSVQCRSTMCLIQAVSNDPQTRGVWGQEMQKLFDQPWGAQFGEFPFATAVYVTPEGQMAYLWYLKRQDGGDSRLQSVSPRSAAI